MSPHTSRLTTNQSGRVLTVTFTNPPRHFFDEDMSLAFDDLTRALARDSSIGAVVFTGHGDHFITHFDVPDLLRGARSTPFPVGYTAARAAAAAASLATRSRAVDRALRSTPAREVVFMARTYRSLNRLNSMDKVVVGAVNGLALGMGCILSLTCDIRLMADDTQMGLPESALGMLAGAGGTQRLTRMIGTSRSVELLLDGRWLNAAEAANLGLVHEVVPRADLLGRAHTVAERLARRSPIITREIKRCVYDNGSRPLPTALAREAASLITTLTTRQAERSLSAYNDHLSNVGELTDDAIMRGWRPLLEHGVPAPSSAATPAHQPHAPH
ncbi:enoyl-CoA hydratase/isomerase family protein [Mycobacterium sp. D16R24]|uniref:enoyl-CoA hydratase/isomerase family protein n=1 Tax=Mycobacterium sp. D16R24 TaxID=1855656 RepID=UPI0009930196|nr:enoyl-CoA hydratase/isomerase family protein [Mycobacterium sp. D16R24]